jgi:RNA recognition motif-containing protein
MDDETLAALFTDLSIRVKSAHVVKGVRKGRTEQPYRASKGFGFVEVEDPAQQQEAVDKVEGTLVGERKITAKIAHEMRPVEVEAVVEAEPEAAKAAGVTA